MDPRDKLQQVSKGALAYGINLDDQVDRVLSRGPSRGSRALVYQGTMRAGTKVAIKVFRFGPPSEEQSVRVSVYSNYYGLTTTFSSVSFLKSLRGPGCVI